MLKGKARWDGMASQGERESERERNRRQEREKEREGGRGKKSWSESSWRESEQRGHDRERSGERPKPKVSFMEEALNRSRDLAKAARNHIPVAVFDTPVEESWTGGGLGLAGPSRPLGGLGGGAGGWGDKTGVKRRIMGGGGAAIAPPASLAAPPHQTVVEQTCHRAPSPAWGAGDTVYPKAPYNANIEIPNLYPSSHPFNDENIVNPLFSSSNASDTSSRVMERVGPAGGFAISRKERERMRDLARGPQRAGAAIPPPPLLTQPSQPPLLDEMGFEVERPLSSPEPSPHHSPSHVQPDTWNNTNPTTSNPIFNSRPFIGPKQSSSLKSTKPGVPKVSSGIGAKIMAK